MRGWGLVLPPFSKGGLGGFEIGRIFLLTSFLKISILGRRIVLIQQKFPREGGEEGKEILD
jgi:hypothetical protein